MSRLIPSSILMSLFDIKMPVLSMAGAPKKEKTKLIRMNVSSTLFAYLTMLKQETMLGASENDVAKYILTQRLEQMRNENYHEQQALPVKAPQTPQSR